MTAIHATYRCRACGRVFSGTRTCTSWRPDPSIMDALSSIFTTGSARLPAMTAVPACPSCRSTDLESLTI